MSPELYNYVGQTKKFFAKHHAVIFTAVIVLFLAVAVYSLSDVLTLQAPVDSNASSSLGSFDQKAIDKIKTLQVSTDKSTPLTFPTPRTNPFAE